MSPAHYSCSSVLVVRSCLIKSYCGFIYLFPNYSELLFVVLYETFHFHVLKWTSACF